ncbi:tetratricopeptide repeat protein [Sphingomonas sp.]|uniref:tetratricopeptide repeat protein n=1 Tax=Sphingomonas sp. TaxID=28214 RepID=UPI0035C878D0
MAVAAIVATPAMARAGVPAVSLAPVSATASEADTAAYLRARVADADGRVALAVADYDRALRDAADDPVVAVRAYREALQYGDFALADRAAATLARADVLPSDAPLVMLAAAARAHDRAAAERALTALDTTPLRILSPPLRAYAALEWRGDPDKPLAQPSADAVARRFVAETRALILLARGRGDAGLAALRPLLGNDQSSTDTRIAAARLLIGRGERDRARALLVGDAPPVVALRARVGDRSAAGAEPGLAFGLSWLLTRVASDLALGPPGSLGYTLTQSALRAEPTNDRARLLLAGALAKDAATDRALAVLDAVDPRGIYAAQATAARIQVLADAGRTAEALRLAEPLATGRDADPADVQRLADLYLRLERSRDAAPLHRRLAERAGADWTDWLQYGAALDRAGEWPDARAALERAYALAPDQPLVLNYLGYALTEHGERPAEAQAMLQQAARARPDDPAIADSLGWALFRAGAAQRALPLIERAAAEDPTNPEIGEHLGDIYWRVGRRYEARYAWTAARASAETPSVAQRLTGKISNGL